MAKDVKIARDIDEGTKRELWARTAGRCEFQGCNCLLFKSPVTHERVNIAQMAHIYSFSPDGPRGRGSFKHDTSGLNKVGNLMLVCYACHKKIDADEEGVRYSAALLKGWKEAHEKRIRIVTGIKPTLNSHVVFYHSKIGDERSPLNFDEAAEAMFPAWYPADERPIDLSMPSEDDDSMAEYWQAQSRSLRRGFDRQLSERIATGELNHLSIFAFAPQPLLIELGAMLTDKVPAVVYQLHREPRTWRWQPHPDGFAFDLIEPEDKSGTPVLALSLSAKIVPERISAVVPRTLSIWELTIANPNNDFLRSEAQLSMFRGAARKVLSAINAAHPNAPDLKVFPAMPLSCATEFGRSRSPKADLPWTIFDQNNKHRRFIPAISIAKTHE